MIKKITLILLILLLALCSCGKPSEPATTTTSSSSYVPSIEKKPEEPATSFIQDAIRYEKVLTTELDLPEVKHRFLIPALTIKTEAAKAFNQKMYEVCREYYDIVHNNLEDNHIYNCGYHYSVKNNIIGIIIVTETSLQGSNSSWTGDYHPFYFDISQNKEITFEEYLGAFSETPQTLYNKYCSGKTYISEDKLRAALISDTKTKLIYEVEFPNSTDTWIWLSL